MYGNRNFTGGQNGNSPQQFPGLSDIPPLIVPGDRVTVHFHSDGSSVDWGYKATIKGLGTKPDFATVPGCKARLTVKPTPRDDIEAAYIAASRAYTAPDDNGEYSYAIRVEPVFTETGLAHCGEYQAAFERYVASHALWTSERDRRLIEWVQERVNKKPGLNVLGAEFKDLVPDVTPEGELID